jgi:hypothetical protein
MADFVVKVAVVSPLEIPLPIMLKTESAYKVPAPLMGSAKDKDEMSSNPLTIRDWPAEITSLAAVTNPKL